MRTNEEMPLAAIQTHSEMKKQNGYQKGTNMKSAKQGKGGLSAEKIETMFSLLAPEARGVFLSGDFNLGYLFSSSYKRGKRGMADLSLFRPGSLPV